MQVEPADMSMERGGAPLEYYVNMLSSLFTTRAETELLRAREAVTKAETERIREERLLIEAKNRLTPAAL